MNFTLATGRIVEKTAAYCVAVKCNGRWGHKFFKTRKGADNEISFLRNCGKHTKDYYGIEDYKLIKGE